MAIRKFRYESLEVRKEKPVRPVVREDREPIRLLTRITFSRMLSRLGTFRVMARTALGEESLVCLGATREEALETARQLAAELPAEAVGLYLEEWQGGTCKGRWQRQPCRREELPLAPAGRRPRRRRGRQPRS
jgi:hypothetical protein